MVKKISLLLVILITPINIFSYHNKTFFMPRPIQQDILFQKISAYDFIKKIYKNKNTDGLKILGTTFYKESTSSTDLASYFFPEGKTELSVFGPDIEGTPDISSTWLTITDENENFLKTFSSKIKIRPKQKSFGLNLQLFKTFNKISKQFSISATLPFIQVQTDLNFEEYEKSTNLEKLPEDRQYKNASANAQRAFNNPLLTHGKMKNGVQKLAGLSDIKLSMQSLLKINQIINANVYGFGIIPTGYHPKVEYLFEPIIGNGQHFSLGAGTNLDVKIWKHKSKNLVLSGGAEYQYLFESTNKRIFDLKNNGSFSRYLDIRRNQPGGLFEITDLVNISTLNCKVTPRSTLNSFISINYKNKNYHLNLGYNFWWRDSEKLKLKENLEEIYAITGVDIDNFLTDDYFNNATIKDHLINPGNPFVAIINDDLDLDTGRITAAFSNKFQFNFGFNGNISNNIYWLNLGSSYEIAGKNSALDNWDVFLQFGLSI
jgi:hypothetical protein